MKKTNKLDTEFRNEEFIVRRKTGTDTIIQSKLSGKEYRRSSAHLKKIGGPSSTELLEPGSTANSNSSSNNIPILSPSELETQLNKRVRQPPVKYHEYVPH
uniref:Uncharacterized protein n=1 Tax=Anopheles atroparvus TaxID=41427 RepID=A0AAG5DPB7_ANOAO